MRPLDYHHNRVIANRSVRLEDFDRYLENTTGALSWVTFDNCYFELGNASVLLSGDSEVHNVTFRGCQFQRLQGHSAPVIDISTSSNLSGIRLIRCDMRGEGSEVAVRIHNRSAGGAPHVDIDYLSCDGQPAGILDLAGLSGARIRSLSRSDLLVDPGAPGILISPGPGGVWGSYRLEDCFLVGGNATHPDIKVTDTGPGAIHVGVSHTRAQVVDMAGAGAWDDGRNHISTVL